MTTPTTDLLTSIEVAEMFRVETSAVTRWARRGKIPHFRTPGGTLRFRRAEVEALWIVDPPPQPKPPAAAKRRPRWTPGSTWNDDES